MPPQSHPIPAGMQKRAYSKAFQLTSDEDYDMKAEILSEGAGIYDIIGMTYEARQVGEAAEAARDRQTASGLFSALLPLFRVDCIAWGDWRDPDPLQNAATTINAADPVPEAWTGHYLFVSLIQRGMHEKSVASPRSGRDNPYGAVPCPGSCRFS